MPMDALKYIDGEGLLHNNPDSGKTREILSVWRPAVMPLFTAALWIMFQPFCHSYLGQYSLRGRCHRSIDKYLTNQPTLFRRGNHHDDPT
jgi:hypothetical protein